MERTTQAITILYNGLPMSDYGIVRLSQLVANYAEVDSQLVKVTIYDHREIANMLVKDATANIDMKNIESTTITNAIRIVCNWANEHQEYSTAMLSLTKKVLLSLATADEKTTMDAILTIAKLDVSDITMPHRRLGMTNALLKCCKNCANVYNLE